MNSNYWTYIKIFNNHSVTTLGGGGPFTPVKEYLPANVTWGKGEVMERTQLHSEVKNKFNGAEIVIKQAEVRIQVITYIEVHRQRARELSARTRK